MRVVHDDVVVRVHHEAEALGVGVRHTEGLSDEIAVSLRNVGAAFIPVKLDRELLRKDWGREDVAEDPTTRKSVGEIEQSVGASKPSTARSTIEVPGGSHSLLRCTAT